MAKFGFIIHPIEPEKDVRRKFPRLANLLSPSKIDFFSAFFPPIYLTHFTGARSQKTGQEIEGWAVACPYTPRRMHQLPVQRVYRKIIQSCHLAKHKGAKIIALGAHTASIGDAGLTVGERVSTPVTTGDSYTVAVAVETLLEAGKRRGIEPSEAAVAIVGATGAIGSASAMLMAEQVSRVILIGRDRARLEKLCDRLRHQRQVPISTSVEMGRLQDADLVLSTSSAIEPIIRPHHLAPGAIVCDIARPHDVDRAVLDLRPDVLVLDGGLVEVPGSLHYKFDFGFPRGTTYACMAEAMILAMEGRMESYTLGKQLEQEKIKAIHRLGRQHGFRLAQFWSFGRPIDERQWEGISTRSHGERSMRSIER